MPFVPCGPVDPCGPIPCGPISPFDTNNSQTDVVISGDVYGGPGSILLG